MFYSFKHSKMSTTLITKAPSKPSVSPIFNGKSADQGCNVQNFRKFHKVAQEVVNQAAYHTCQMVLRDTTGSMMYDQVKALDAVSSKSATETLYTPGSASFQDPVLKVFGPGKHAIVYGKKEYVAGWEVVANEDDTPVKGAGDYDEQNMAVKVLHLVQNLDTADKSAPQKSNLKLKKTFKCPDADTPTHPSMVHATMWTDLKSKHRALATNSIPADTTTTQRDYWIDVFVHIIPDMDDEERGAPIMALRARESKHTKRDWSAKWKAFEDVDVDLDKKVWAPIFLDLTKEGNNSP
jgi:hypothetical protein